MGVFRLRGQPKRDDSIIVRSCKATQSPVSTTARTISKISLREKSAEVDALVASFQGDAAEIRTCLRRSDASDRRQRVKAASGLSPIQDIVNHRVGSGLPAGTSIEWRLIEINFEIERDWFGHGDAHLFNVDKTNVTTVRPLPAGEYLTYYDVAIKGHVDCGQYATTDKTMGFAVTATAPVGTLAESFFDPYADGGSVTGTSTVGTISWESGRVRASASDIPELPDLYLDFIGLDGTTTLSLVVEEATRTADTVSWTVPTQPWSAGDQLMLRLRGTGCSGGVAVEDPANNPELVGDCNTLLGARDTLAGTATLNWDADTV